MPKNIITIFLSGFTGRKKWQEKNGPGPVPGAGDHTAPDGIYDSKIKTGRRNDIFCIPVELEERDMEIIAEVKNLKKYYGKGDNVVRAVDGIDLQIEKENSP